MHAARPFNPHRPGSRSSSMGLAEDLFRGPMLVSRLERRRRLLLLLIPSTAFVVLLPLAVVLGTTRPSEAAPPVRSLVVEREAPVALVDVLVPVREIESGTPLEPSMFAKVWRPKAGTSEDAVRSFEQIRGMYARSIIPGQQTFNRAFVTDERPANPVVASIPPGFRAVTIGVDVTASVEGWARAGAHVDIHWIVERDGDRTVLELVRDARILSAERQLENSVDLGSAPIPGTVTLLVTERDAQRVSLAATGGKLVLHLRGFREEPRTTTPGGAISVSDLLGRPNLDQGSDIGVEGTIRVRLDDGSVDEWALIRGKLFRRE